MPSTNIGANTGNVQAARYLYEALKSTFAAYKQHKDTTVRMSILIFLKLCVSQSPGCLPAPDRILLIGAPCAS